MKDQKKCILVADDDRQILEILELLLSSEGYAVVTAQDGLSVSQKAGQEIDLYLLDVDMPGQTGIMAAAQIRKKYDAPIVFLTAYSGESDKVLGFSVGADDYIVKPFSSAELLMRIRAILRRHVSSGIVRQKENQLAIYDAVLDLDSQFLRAMNGLLLLIQNLKF